MVLPALLPQLLENLVDIEALSELDSMARFQSKGIAGRDTVIRWLLSQHCVDIHTRKEGGGGRQIVEAEAGHNMGPHQEVGQVEGQGGLVPVLGPHQISHLVVDADNVSALNHKNQSLLIMPVRLVFPLVQTKGWQ